MKPSVLALPALAAGLVLVAGPGRADAHLVSLAPLPTMAQALAPPHVLAPPHIPAPRFTFPPGLTLPRIPPPSASNPNVMPHSYMIYGLKSGPGGMACTDRGGEVIPMPFNPQITVGPYRPSAPTFSIQTLPPVFTLPRLPVLPAPKKLPRK